MMIDLHTHSTASDGQHSPTELAQLVFQKGIRLWSLTDHDTFDGIAEAGEMAGKLGIPFIPGIEISTQDIEEIHILGYYIDINDPGLKRKCEEFREARLGRGPRIRDYLKTKGIEVNLDTVVGYAQGSVLARPHFARYLVEYGYVSNRKEAFDKYLDTDEFKSATDRRKPAPVETINLIHNAGGMAVLAHPGYYHMSEVELKDMIDRLYDIGLDGIECFYSKHSKEQTQLYLEIARKYGFKVSGGSDFHGEKVKPDIALGIDDKDSSIMNTWLDING